MALRYTGGVVGNLLPLQPPRVAIVWAVALVQWLARLPSAQTIRGSNPGGGAEKENCRKKISLLLSSASKGTVSRRSSRPRALVARVSCNLYTDLK